MTTIVKTGAFERLRQEIRAMHESGTGYRDDIPEDMPPPMFCCVCGWVGLGPIPMKQMREQHTREMNDDMRDGDVMPCCPICEDQIDIIPKLPYGNNGWREVLSLQYERISEALTSLEGVTHNLPPEAEAHKHRLREIEGEIRAANLDTQLYCGTIPDL